MFFIASSAGKKIDSDRALSFGVSSTNNLIEARVRIMTTQSSRSLKDLAIRGYLLLASAGGLLQPLVLLVFRVCWGLRFFYSGKGKLNNHGDIVEFFTSLGIPMPELNAWFVGGVECVGGLLLLIGLCSRPVALILAINMLVAYLTVASDRAALLGIFTDADPFLKAAPFFFLLTAILIFAFGPGRLSVDGLIQWNSKKQGLLDK